MSDLQKDSFIGGPIEMGFEIEQRINAGWTIDPDNPLTAGIYGNLSCGFVRDPANANDPPPKLSRAEILAKARAAKAEKSKQAEGEVQ